MKKVLLNPKAWLSALVLAVVACAFTACDGDDDPQVVPTVTTGTPTDLTPSTATIPGEIVSDGGNIVLAAGICYSISNATPTVADDTTKTTVLTGKFASRLKDLASGSTYHVRSYATSAIGTGYGEVMTFTTGNEAPVATNVVITGEIKGDVEVEVTYQYNDKENDVQSGTTFQWYRANDAAGASKVAIENATTKTYRISDEDQGKFIWVGVTPKAAAGTLVGLEANSEKKGPVGEASTVTFMYNGNEVTYGIISSTKTSRRWMDRNLGAPNTPTAYNDYANLGDLFQWGRSADGHQLIKRTPDVGNPLSGTSTALDPSTTDELSLADTPVNNKFITTSADPYNWRSNFNNNLWQNGINNPCPAGWRIPTIDEWIAEELGPDPATNFTQMNMTNTGIRYTDGSIGSTSSRGYYWSSTAIDLEGDDYSQAISMSSSATKVISNNRGSGLGCRCIKDENK